MRIFAEGGRKTGLASALIAAISLTPLLAAVPAQAEDSPYTDPHPVSDPHVITLRADPSCPSNCEPDSDHPGYDIELAREIYGAAGYKVDYRLLSWSRTLIEVRNGTIDGFVAGIKEDAPDFVFPEEPAGVLINAFAVRKGSHWQWNGIASLDGKVLGYIPDYQYFPELKTYIEAHAKDPKAVQGVAMMNANELNLRKLSVGRVDITCDDLTVLQYLVNLMKLDDKIEIIDPRVSPPVPEYIAFGPSNPRAHELARLWDDGIRRLRKTGELKRILDRYGIQDWK
ncbi:MAG TPA: transporter substrate-binding domain-containing protein [Candidatus Sulfotelmatobacter sp.]|nr:transporter substrate-binding domain-containing protein [Candidatus Sulfotelmatobacter sp.]